MKSINIRNVEFTYKEGDAVFKNFNLLLTQQEVEGKTIAIMGSSGSGKSTLMKLLLGVVKPLSGSINMQPTNPIFSYVPQDPVLFEHLSIEDNARYFQFAGAFKKRFNEKLYSELVKDLGLEEVLKSKKAVLGLSGGQKQRLSVLRALSIEPDFLLLDEPCNGLDAEIKRTFLNKLRKITQHYGLFVLYITHHKTEAQLVADEIVYLVQNRDSGVVSYSAQASVQDFIQKPPVMEAAQVFRFPEVKLLPVFFDKNNEPVIAVNEKDVSQYWLIENKNIIISGNGFPFKLISKTSTYSIFLHEESGVEWILSAEQASKVGVGETTLIKISDDVIKYTKEGFIL